MPVHKISAAFGQDLEVEWPCPACGQKTLQIDQESFKKMIRLRAEDWKRKNGLNLS